jgi:Myotubularin-like phosphatase domain
MSPITLNILTVTAPGEPIQVQSMQPARPTVRKVDYTEEVTVTTEKAENNMKIPSDVPPKATEHSSENLENMENDTKYLTGESPICNINDTRIQIAGNRSLMGNLVLTNYRLQLVVSKKILSSINSPSLYSFLNVPLGSIDKVEKEKKSKEQKLYEQKLFNLHNSNNSSVNIASNVTVSIYCKDMRILRLTLPYTSNINSRISSNNLVQGGSGSGNTEHDIENFLQTVADVAFPYDRRGLFAFSHKMTGVTYNNNNNNNSNNYNNNNYSNSNSNNSYSNNNNNSNSYNNNSNNNNNNSINNNNGGNGNNSSSSNGGSRNNNGNNHIDDIDNYANNNNYNNKNNGNNNNSINNNNNNRTSSHNLTGTRDNVYRNPTAISPLPPFNIMNEFNRLGVLDILAVTEKSEKASLFRISDVNMNYNLCNTYPRVIIVPSKISDEELFMSANFRSGHRLPALCWADKETGVCVCACVCV